MWINQWLRGRGEVAVERFRAQLYDADVEFSGYVDNSGYIHALASSGEDGSTWVIPHSWAVLHEKGVRTVIYNHPSDSTRLYGGTLSSADYTYIASVFRQTNGIINTMVATAKEGVYTAKITKVVSERQIKAADRRARASVNGKTYPTQKSMWGALHDAEAREMVKIGIVVTYEPRGVNRETLVTQKIC